MSRLIVSTELPGDLRYASEIYDTDDCEDHLGFAKETFFKVFFGTPERRWWVRPFRKYKLFPAPIIALNIDEEKEENHERRGKG